MVFHFFFFPFFFFFFFFFFWVWLKTRVFRSPELFSVFWPIWTMLKTECSRLFLWFPILPALFPSLCVLYNQSLVNIPRAPITIGITVTFIFRVLLRGPLRQAKSTFLQNLFLVVVDYNKVWLSGWDQVIRLYLKIPERFVCFIL